MTLRRLILALVFGIVTLGGVRPAGAQIYIWHDANGNPVVGDSLPRGTQAYTTYAVPGTAKPLLATRPLAEGFSNQYDGLIERYATANRVRTDLIRAVIQVESGFNPRARSPKGARGLMQLMPATALDLGVSNVYDPEDNIRGGVRYLKSLLDRYGNDEALALAAYNAGPLAVEKYGNAVPPYRETQDYVERVQNISPPAPGSPGTKSQAQADAPQSLVRIVPLPPGVRTLYKTVVFTAEGRPVARYSDTKPSAGEYEVYSYPR
ncbi:MAG: lytic transglycosylase domain-containing protein [Acidobacteriota bacterium]